MTESIGYQLPKVYSVTTCASPVIFIQPSQNLLSQGKASVLKGNVIVETGVRIPRDLIPARCRW